MDLGRFLPIGAQNGEIDIPREAWLTPAKYCQAANDHRFEARPGKYRLHLASRLDQRDRGLHRARRKTFCCSTRPLPLSGRSG